MKFEGIYAPVITPFDRDGALDPRGYAACIDFLVDRGVHGIVIGGTTGESYALETEERIRQFGMAHSAIRGRVPWIAGINDLRTEKVCELGVAARDAGADALLLAVPPYSLPTGEELAEHTLAVDRAVGLPLMLYNYPGRSGASFGESCLRRLEDCSNVTAIKESSGDLERVHLLVTRLPNEKTRPGRRGAPRNVRPARQLRAPSRALRRVAVGGAGRDSPADHEVLPHT